MAKNVDKFLMPELPIRNPICHTCQPLEWRSDVQGIPRGIPLGIFINEWDHRYPVPGDHGVTYEPKQLARQ